MSSSNPYKQFEKVLGKCLTISEEEFATIIPSKYRGKQVAKILYNYYTQELETRKKECKRLLYSLKTMNAKENDFSSATIEDKITLMKSLKKAATTSIHKMETEINRRKHIVEKLKRTENDMEPIDTNRANLLIKQFNKLSKKIN